MKDDDNNNDKNSIPNDDNDNANNCSNVAADIHSVKRRSCNKVPLSPL